VAVIHTADRQRLTPDNRPDGCQAFSAGRFVIRADGTARFDRHHHDFDEFWFVAAGTGTVLVGDTPYPVTAGDIVYTAAGRDHDILDVGEELRIFWLSWALPPDASGEHLHRRAEDAAKHPVPIRTHAQPDGPSSSSQEQR
jgi:mannose-6-phosphate isomerase-like protein (cupin superfamily)